MGYVSRLPNGRFSAEELDGTFLRDQDFESENEAAIFIDALNR
jgi:hypothetical protein